MWSQLALSFQRGDAYLYIMMGLAWLGLLILIERFIMLTFVFRIDFKKFLLSLKKMVQAEDIDRAVNLCKKTSNTSLPYISLRALEAAESDPSTVRGVIEEETIDFLPRVESRLQVIPVVSTIILLVGVLGTIDHLWGAFHSIDVLDTAEKQASLAGGIAGSLSHTAVGLLICIILLAGHQLLRSAAVKLTERIHYGVAVLTNLLAPAEMASFVPAMGMMQMAPQQAAADTQEHSQQQNQVAEESDDNFDDASVEDIKDEEEII
jgi:biopolymer transport protein ExbB/TolQ